MKKILLLAILGLGILTAHAQLPGTVITATASTFVNIGDPVPGGNSTVAFPPANVLDGNSNTSWLTWSSSAWLQLNLSISNVVWGVQIDFQTPWKNCKVQFLKDGVLAKEVPVAEYSSGPISITVQSDYGGLVNQIKIFTDKYSSTYQIPISISEVKPIYSYITGLTATSGSAANPAISGAEKAIDGNSSTYWTAPPSSWLQVSLPSQPYRVSGIQLNFGPPCTNYQVQLFSVDGDVLETINNTNPSLCTPTLTILPSYTGAVSYIRISPTMINSMDPLVFEVVLYGIALPLPVSYSFTYDDRGNCLSRPILGGGVKSATIADKPAPEKQKDDSFIKLYPNPTKGLLTVEFSEFDDQVPGSLLVADLTGRVVYSGNTLTKRYTIDLSARPAGQYLLIYQNGNDKQSWKLIKY
ncbi:discoidin domain-containing protein [Gaoshiqia sp. Z1-71]|uniref:discoidin domain-containing protein n=1 Tax=Gaoshiqia hydrogeniformans TaxID=3290090 RepID=UPI003BF7C2FB